MLERLYEAELDHLHELEEKYHAHLDREVVELSADEENLLSNWLFRGIHVAEDSGIADLYQAALEMERRTRDHFHKLARELPAGPGEGSLRRTGGGGRRARGAARRRAGAVGLR